MDGTAQKNDKPRKNGMETIVANATLIYLILFFLGGLVHYFYPVPVGAGKLSSVFGLVLVLAGPLLIIWSQASIRRFKKESAAGV